MRMTLGVAALALVLVVPTLALVVLSAGSASATCPPDPVDEFGVCASAGVVIHPPGPEPTESTNGTNSNPSAPTCPGAPGGACQHGNAWWSSMGQCYAYPLDPPPPVGSPTWVAVMGEATEGTVMACADSGELFGAPLGEEAAGGIPDARTIALNAVERVPFVTPEVHTAPAEEQPTYVHLENWLWVPEGQWRTVEASVKVGGTTVTVTAEPSKIEWDMGDGHTKVCRNAGRAWAKGMTDAAKTSCGYAYDTISVKDAAGRYNPAGRFGVTARFFYEVRWSCTGACSAPGGPLGEYSGPLSPVAELEVRQRQTVVTQ
jgi:hypothetical protein